MSTFTVIIIINIKVGPFDPFRLEIYNCSVQGFFSLPNLCYSLWYKITLQAIGELRAFSCLSLLWATMTTIAASTRTTSMQQIFLREAVFCSLFVDVCCTL
jgi:hypothetical protein